MKLALLVIDYEFPCLANRIEQIRSIIPYLDIVIVKEDKYGCYKFSQSLELGYYDSHNIFDLACREPLSDCCSVTL